MTKLNLSRSFRVAGAEAGGLERIEVGYLFRISRFVPLALASVASVALVGSVLVLLFSAIPPRTAREPSPAVTPAEVSLSLQDVRGAMRSAPGEGTTTTTTTTTVDSRTPSASSPQADSMRLRLGQNLAAVQALFPASAYSWEDQYVSQCVSEYFGTCYRTQQVQTAAGIAPLVHRALNAYDEAQGQEWVPVGSRGGGYMVNASNPEKKVEVLRELRRVLATVPVAERRDVLTAWSGLRRDREAARLQQVASEESRVARERAEEEARYAADLASRVAARTAAATAMASALGALWMIGLTLAVLAIERNTRAFRSLAPAQTREPDGSKPVPAYAPQS